MLEAAFGNEKRFAIQPKLLPDFLSGKYDSYFSRENKAGSFRKDAILSAVRVNVDLVKPQEGLRGKFMSSVFPKFTLSVSKLDLAVIRKQGGL